MINLRLTEMITFALLFKLKQINATPIDTKGNDRLSFFENSILGCAGALDQIPTFNTTTRINVGYGLAFMPLSIPSQDLGKFGVKIYRESLYGGKSAPEFMFLDESQCDLIPSGIELAGETIPVKQFLNSRLATVGDKTLSSELAVVNDFEYQGPSATDSFLSTNHGCSGLVFPETDFFGELSCLRKPDADTINQQNIRSVISFNSDILVSRQVSANATTSDADQATCKLGSRIADVEISASSSSDKVSEMTAKLVNSAI
jgi:hypothetical protein